METIVPPATPDNPETEQDLQKLKKLRSNLMVMEQEQRKLQAAWNGNSKEKNKKLNMEEQIEMARICVINARNTFADYQKFLKDVKYQAWNSEKTDKDIVIFSETPKKSPEEGTNENSLPQLKKSLKRGSHPTVTGNQLNQKSLKGSEGVKQHPVLKSNVDQVNTVLMSSSQQKRNIMFKRLGNRDICGKPGNFNRSRNRRRDKKHIPIKKNIDKLGSDLKRAKKHHLHETAGLQKLPHLVCQFNNYSKFNPNLSCPVGKIYKSSQEMLAHVFFVHRGEISNQTTKTKKILLACPYNDQLADIKCGDSFHAFSSYDYNQNFELQLSVTLLKLQRHICDKHLASHTSQLCSMCGQEVLEAEPRHYWQHLATHLQEYKQLLPPGVIPGAPVISSIKFSLPCNMGCALSFKSSCDFISHLTQDHWQEMMTFVSSSQSIRWTCPAKGSCGFSIYRPVLGGALVEVGKALTLLSSHLRQYHCEDQPADQCPRCRISLQYLPDHAAWQHISDHASIDLVWCGHCGLFCSRGEVSEHCSRQCKAGDMERAEWNMLELEMFKEEMENIGDRKESLNKINKVVEESANEWMQDDLKEKVINHIEKRKLHEYLETMVANKIIKHTDLGTIATLVKITEKQQTRALQKLLPGKKKRRIERGLAHLKKAVGGYEENFEILRNNLIDADKVKKKKENPRRMRNKDRNIAAENAEQDKSDTKCSNKPTEICSSIVWELFGKAVSQLEDYEVSKDEIEFVQLMKRQSAWDLLTPTPKLAKPRPPARYGGMGEFLAQFKQGFSESNQEAIESNSINTIHDFRNLCTDEVAETITAGEETARNFRLALPGSITPEHNHKSLISVTKPAYAYQPVRSAISKLECANQPVRLSESKPECEQAHQPMRLAVSKLEHAQKPSTSAISKPEHAHQPVRSVTSKLEHANHPVRPGLSKTVNVHQPEGLAVTKPKYTCQVCGTQFSKEQVLHFHLAVHK